MRTGAGQGCLRRSGERATNKNAWGPNTLIKQGAKLTATWEDVWEDLPSAGAHAGAGSRRAGALASNESEARRVTGASLFTRSSAAGIGPQGGTAGDMQRLRQDEPRPAGRADRAAGSRRWVSAEIFTALFELELCRQGKADAGQELRADRFKPLSDNFAHVRGVSAPGLSLSELSRAWGKLWPLLVCFRPSWNESFAKDCAEASKERQQQQGRQGGLA